MTTPRERKLLEELIHSEAYRIFWQRAYAFRVCGEGQIKDLAYCRRRARRCVLSQFTPRKKKSQRGRK